MEVDKNCNSKVIFEKKSH